MRKQFKYAPPALINNITYAIAMVFILAALEFYGPAVWSQLSQWVPLDILFIGGGFTFYMVWFWAVSLPYLLLDHYKKPHFLFRYKIQTGKDGSTTTLPPGRLKHTIAVVLKNQLLGTLPVLVGVYFLMTWRGMGYEQAFPNWVEIVWQLAVFLLCEEILFYTVHRTLHQKRLYGAIHRIHHEYKESICIVTHYVHFAEHLLGNLLPIFAGAIILGSHPITLILWIGLGVTNALHTHSGYHFPWMAYSLHHDYHHFRIRGNYGVLGILDWVFKTDGPFMMLHKNYTREQKIPEEQSTSGQYSLGNQ